MMPYVATALRVSTAYSPFPTAKDNAPLSRPSPYSVHHLLRPFVQRKSDLRIDVIHHLHMLRQATLAVDTEPVISEPGMARRLAAKSIYYALGL